MRTHMKHILNRSLLISSAAGLAISSQLVLAQAEPTTAPSTQPTSLPATQVGNGKIPAEKINLNFKDALIDTVLDHLSDAAGFIVLKDKDVKIDQRITVMSRQPLTPDEAVALLNTVLKANEATAIQMGRVLRITSITNAKKSNIPVRYGADPTKVAQTDELITQVIPLTSVDAVKLKQDLTPLIGTTADLTSNASSNAIIITDTSANIRRVVEIVSNLDKRDILENSIKVKQLKFADASAAAKLITDIFKTEQTNQQNQNVQGPGAFFRALQQQGRGRGSGNQPQGSTEEGQTRAGRVTASADTRTNTIVVTGPADTLKVIDTVLEQLDANPASESTFFHYNLKNGQAARIAATLNSLFGNSSNGSVGNVAGTRQTSLVGSASRTTTGSRTGSTGFGSTGFGSSGFGSSGLGTGSTFGGTGPINRTSAGVTGGAVGTNVGSMSELYGQVYVVADTDTNSLLVATASRFEKQVKEVIEELDRAVPQVLIKVLIAEVSHDNTDDLGVDFSILNTRDSGNGQTLGTDFGVAAATGGLKVSVLEPHVTATLRVLSEQGKLDVLSRPYILASDNQLATITVGQEAPFITNTRITDTGGQLNTIQYRDIGIILNVTPHINPDGLVILDVAPEISSLTGTTVPIQAGVDAPVIAKRSADSRVGIPNGQTIVIGGMMEDKKTSTIRKVPLLGDIPVLGLLFKRTEITKSKTELLIFLTPHVAQQPAKLHNMSQDEMNGTKLTPNAVQPGTFDEHLKGMQRGKTTDEPNTDLTTPATEAPKRELERPLPGTEKDKKLIPTQ